MSQWLILLAGLLAIVLIGVATYVAWWALFKDRGKGRRRCPRCWHDMSHTVGLTCSECGRTARSERGLARTRRRWGVAALAIVVCVSCFGMLYWKIGDQRWSSYVPTRMLILIMPVAGAPSGQISRELNSRLGTPDVTDDHWTSLVNRCAAGDPWTRPGTDDWRAKYGSFLRTRRAMIANNASLDWLPGERETLLDLPAYVDMTSREAWPTGAAPRIRVRVEDWWPLGGGCRVTVQPRTPGAKAVRFRRSTRVANWASYSFSLQDLPADVERVGFDVTVERREEGRGAADDARWIVMSEHDFELPIHFDAELAAGLIALDDEPLTQAVWDTFSQGAVQWAGGGFAPVRFNFTPQSTHQSPWDSTAIGVTVEVMKDEKVARQLDIWWLAGASTRERNVGWEAHGEDLDLLAEIEEGGAWTMRVTGDPRLALRAGDADSYWKGRFTIPLKVHVRRGSSPDPIWWQDDDEGDG